MKWHHSKLETIYQWRFQPSILHFLLICVHWIIFYPMSNGENSFIRFIFLVTLSYFWGGDNFFWLLFAKWRCWLHWDFNNMCVCTDTLKKKILVHFFPLKFLTIHNLNNKCFSGEQYLVVFLFTKFLLTHLAWCYIKFWVAIGLRMQTQINKKNNIVCVTKLLMTPEVL